MQSQIQHQEKFVAFVKQAGQFAEAVVAQDHARAVKAAEVAELAPHIAKVAVAHNVIDASTEAAAVEALKDHAMALRFVHDVIVEKVAAAEKAAAEKTAAAIGEGVAAPAGPTLYKASSDNYVGRKGDFDRESDKKFADRILSSRHRR